MRMSLPELINCICVLAGIFIEHIVILLQDRGVLWQRSFLWFFGRKLLFASNQRREASSSAMASGQASARSGVSPDGVPALPACHCVVAGSDRAQRSTDYLPDHGLQQLVKRFLCCLGKLAPDGARLKQRLFDSLPRCGTGTPKLFHAPSFALTKPKLATLQINNLNTICYYIS